ncbi:MAG: hypothetical protein JNK38_12135 [Acidobacteria bacterium]|nr:hypothetical protein [Acidobacteriota bacterium]
MKKDKNNEQESLSELTDLNDELRPEYDLGQLQVRRMGLGRRQFGDHIVRLEPDVAAVFQDANAVNEALRLLIKVAQSSNQSLAPKYSS